MNSRLEFMEKKNGVCMNSRLELTDIKDDFYEVCMNSRLAFSGKKNSY